MNYKTQFINDSDKLYRTINAVCLKNKTVVGLTSPQYIIKATDQALLSELNRIDPTNRKLNKKLHVYAQWKLRAYSFAVCLMCHSLNSTSSCMAI